MVMMAMRGFVPIGLVLALAICVVSCAVGGTFGFKKFGDDTYHQLSGTPEFASDEAVDWVYKFKRKYGERAIGIVYQKKELVWVEVLSRSENINNFNLVVYGTIKDLEPGVYQLIITDVEKDNKLIDKKDFTIYEKDRDEDD
jgi:hypothetical protein